MKMTYKQRCADALALLDEYCWWEYRRRHTGKHSERCVCGVCLFCRLRRTLGAAKGASDGLPRRLETHSL